jgi:protein TonB
MFSTLVASKPKREGASGALAGLVSLVIHGGIVALLFWATMNIGEASEAVEEVINLFEVPEEAPPPPPPPPPPPMEEAPPPVDVADIPQGFQTLSPPTVILPDIPPPSTDMNFDARDFSGEGVEGGRADGNPDREVTVEDIDAAPRFTPYTVAPVLRNTEEARRALQRFYPPLLRDAGIGGTVILWFLIDEQGNVVRTQVQRTSGHEGLDEAATRVAEVMRFTPAMNRDRRVRVWVQLPIEFRTAN